MKMCWFLYLLSRKYSNHKLMVSLGVVSTVAMLGVPSGTYLGKLRVHNPPKSCHVPS